MLDFMAFGGLPVGLQYVNGGMGVGELRVLLGSGTRTMRPEREDWVG